jgi:predicted amidohydrolase
MPRRRVRVATVQYWIRPVDSFDDFHDQVKGLVDTAADYDCALIVFPEYFTLQLLTIGDTSRPAWQQVRGLARLVPRYVEMMSDLAIRSRMYIVAGSIAALDEDGDTLYNDSYIFGPSGDHVTQGKLHMTRWEAEDWRVSPRKGIHVIEAAFGRMAVAICYDVEFPELARAAAHQGCYMLIVPSCTDDRQGFLRVRYCAHARAIENQMFVVHSGTVGSLPQVPSVSLNWGQASILTPSDFAFARDGILAEGNANQEQMVIGELDLDLIRESREEGTVLPLRDSVTTAEATARLDVSEL